MGIEQRDTVEASAACGQFPFLSYHIICDKKDLAPPESFSRNYCLLSFSFFSLVFRIPILLQPSRKMVIPLSPFS